MSDIYLSLTESPTVVTLSQPVVSGVLSSNVTVTNVVSVNVVTMPAINVQAAPPSVTTVAGTVIADLANGYSNEFVESYDESAAPNAVAAHVKYTSGGIFDGTVTMNPPSINWSTIRLNYPTNPVFNGNYQTGSLPSGNSLAAGMYFSTDFGGNGPYFAYGSDSYGLPPSFTGERWYFQTAGGENIFYASSTTTNLSAVTGWVDINGANALVYITPLSTVPVYVSNQGLTNAQLRASAVPVSGTVTASLSSANLNTVTVGIRGTVTVGNSVTIGSLPAISGTVTANVFGKDNTGTPQQLKTDATGGLFVSASGSVQCVDEEGLIFGSDRNFPISGTVTVGNSVTIGSLPAISGTVTANSIFPRVTLIDGSGTVATANTAITVFASSSTRSYLLVQVTTGSAFVNVGATATTVNGINLTAGQGYSWETTIPQGIVSLISTTTNSRYVAKEA